MSRGPSWQWSDQDGLSSGSGLGVITDASGNWDTMPIEGDNVIFSVKVQWDTGREALYRFGPGAFDLTIHIDAPEDLDGDSSVQDQVREKLFTLLVDIVSCAGDHYLR